MHTLHDYVAKQLADKIKSRHFVVWYDERREFSSFVAELRGEAAPSVEAKTIAVGSTNAKLSEYAGSLFELRAAVEPHFSGDTPDPVIAYVPGIARDRKGSVLMELEKAGCTWEPQLKQLAKNVLLQKYTIGVVDEMLPHDRRVTYEDLAHAASGSAVTEPPSILKSIFSDALGHDSLLATWMADDGRDDLIVAKDAVPELIKLVRSRFGLELPDDASPAKLRAIVVRFMLAGEFRNDLRCAEPSTLAGVPAPETKDFEAAVHVVAAMLRDKFAERYVALADQVEAELGLKSAALPAASLGTIDTFRFEERALLRHTSQLIAEGRFDEALVFVAERDRSFWLDRDVARKAQWETVRRMGELGRVARAVRDALGKVRGDAAAWVEAYASRDGWYRLDQAQRQLESLVANLDDEPEERPLAVVRRAYEDTCRLMAEGFGRALSQGLWAVPGVVQQTKIFSELVADSTKPVAYFLVDAMRFEMGIEISERLPKTSEIAIRPAIGALPSITPIGMGALMPGASSSFSVVEQGGKLGSRVDGNFLPDVTARKKHAAARIPKIEDIGLDDLLAQPLAKLTKRIADKQVIIVRSQEIDHAGEGGFTFQARQVMDNVIENLARAIRKLAAAGVEHSVLSADHGHLFFANDRDESMRTDAPGGQTVELHRRCWIGRGGSTPPGCVRVPATALGYDSDLDFVFPPGIGVFKAGGDLAFHHGGPTLQEMIVPVLSVRTKARSSGRPAAGGPIEAHDLPERVTNRIFSVKFTLGNGQTVIGASGMQVRPMLVAGGKHVGSVGMVVDAEFDRTSGCVTLEHGKVATVAFVMSGADDVTSIRIVLQDPATDAELYRSPTDVPVQFGVS
jgi:hypothetical protein